MTGRAVIVGGLMLWSTCAPAQDVLSGGREFALGGSSVMWQPHPGALFSNLGELARIHQNEFLLSTDRLKRLSSLGGVAFIPRVGTVAAGIGQHGGATWHTVGYGGLVGRHHTVGAALNILEGSIERVTLSFGGALHFPGRAGEYSGIHLGASVVSLSTVWDEIPSAAAVGAAYWLLPDIARLQGAWEYRGSEKRILMGAELRMTSQVALQVGTRGFESMSAGISLAASHFAVDLAAGRTMVVCSFRFLLGETASERHAAKIREAEEALEEERYAQAYASALAASVYDEYSLRARLLADSSMARLLAAREGLLTRAVELEKERKYPEAIEFYRRLLIIYPDHPDAEERIERAEEQLGLYIEELIAEGDSLKQRREFDRARRRYELVQQLAPEDQRPQQRMAEIQAALRVNFRPILDRARDRLSKNQLDEAQRDFERVLAAEPQNREARVGLQMIRSRRTENIFERGKAAFDAADYLTALPIFLEVLEADDQHRRAREYLERTRAILRPQVELYYRAGLQYYMSDKYQAALDAWNTVLLIEPSHRDTLEYKKRAEEKMRALQRLETP